MNKKKWMEKHLGRPGRRALKRMAKESGSGAWAPAEARRLVQTAKARHREYRELRDNAGYRRTPREGDHAPAWDPDGPANNAYWRPLLAVWETERVMETIEHGHAALTTARLTLLQEPTMRYGAAARRLGKTRNQVRADTELFLRLLETRYKILAGTLKKPAPPPPEPKPHHRGPWDRR